MSWHAPPGYTETHRLRIVNRADGAISVSTDAGKSWQLIGRVLVPATTVVQGYIAAEYADPGTVAAIAVHGHRIRVSADDKSLHAPLILSLDPKSTSVKRRMPVTEGIVPARRESTPISARECPCSAN